MYPSRSGVCENALRCRLRQGHAKVPRRRCRSSGVPVLILPAEVYETVRNLEKLLHS